MLSREEIPPVRRVTYYLYEAMESSERSASQGSEQINYCFEFRSNQNCLGNTVEDTVLQNLGRGRKASRTRWRHQVQPKAAPEWLEC